jgi:phosphoribosylanthranilate isomerase
MNAVRVKVCGITTPRDAELAAREGADAIGLVFWPRSPRAVDVTAAREIVRALPPFVTRVGVFVNAPREELLRTVSAVGLDALQLHGDERPEDLAGLPCRVVKALRTEAGSPIDAFERFAPHCAGLLLDAGSAAVPGGTGETCDWTVARAVRARVPYLILAGGLRPANVSAALAAVRPDAVDVSSGVESSPGRKDPALVRAFIAALRASIVLPSST